MLSFDWAMGGAGRIPLRGDKFECRRGLESKPKEISLGTQRLKNTYLQDQSHTIDPVHWEKESVFDILRKDMPWNFWVSK